MSEREQGINKRTAWCVMALALLSFATGVVLSRRIESGVRLEKVTLAGDTPALRFLPPGAGPHPIALLAHGFSASKEMLFRAAEALAAAGFECYAVDLPGHGESAQSFSFAHISTALDKVGPALGTVDVFVGHSMGVYAGAAGVRGGALHPRLFVAIGGIPDLGQPGPQLLLMAGRFEEFPRMVAQMKARTDARVVISPWCDHALEPFDPKLINPAVEAACAAVGKTPPTPPTCWRWRLLGVVLGFVGALGVALLLPDTVPKLAKAQGLLLPLLIIVANALTLSPWLGAAPHLVRLPLVVAAALGLWLLLRGASRLGTPRWSLFALVMSFTLGYLSLRATLLANSGSMLASLVSLIGMLAAAFAGCLVVGALLGELVSRRGSKAQGDLAMAIYVGYVIGQWVPRFL